MVSLKYTFRASNTPKNPPQFGRSNTTSPIDHGSLPISNGDPELDSGKVTTIVKHNYLTKTGTQMKKGK